MKPKKSEPLKVEPARTVHEPVKQLTNPALEDVHLRIQITPVDKSELEQSDGLYLMPCR